jgi:protein-S-isoprenylcysteine O-methyltransferase Ste14
MPLYAYVIVVAGWLVWGAPFLLKRNKEKAQQLDRRARWGIVIVAIGFALLWQGRFWENSLPTWRLALSIVFFALASILSWTARAALGRQWRFDAGLIAEHELVTSGPYRVIRHPIYTSMLCLMLGMGLVVTPLPLLALAMLLGVIGTEIRVRIEDGLLATRFGEPFSEYRRRVRAYIPWIR